MSESNIQGSPGSIFICYRREDSADVTGRIYDRLADYFGPERVFMDVEAIRLGYDFRSEIDETIKVCSIVIVVIGDKWLAEADGKRRIDDENDRVRIEIEAALRREIPIIPVLTRGASHPTKVMLPASLEALAYRHGTSVHHEHFRGDVDFLITQVDKLLARRESTPSKPAESKEPQETEAVATSGVTPISVGEATPQFPTRDTPPELDSGTERSQQDSVAIAKLVDRADRYWSGDGMPQDLGKAAELYQKAADLGDVNAQYSLGHCYEYGLAVTEDLGKAAELYQKAAGEGHVYAQFKLGAFYQKGEGVPKNLGKAAELYQKAADQGCAPAQFLLGVLYQNGDGVPRDLGKVAELYQKAADQGYAPAQNNLAILYENGDGVPRDFGKMEQLYQKAADQGYQDAIANIKRLTGHWK